MFAKLKIECTLKVITGLHIGDNSGYSPIGALDNPVVKDPLTGYPMIPGSSLKGKMRTLLVKAKTQTVGPLNECKKDPAIIQRVFGSPGENNEKVIPAQLQFTDAFVSNADEMLQLGGLTEVKSENTINRATSVANPRSMERIVRGTCFKVVWFYTLNKAEELEEDLQLLAEGCKLLSVDYLGGSGTRGYGRVGFDHFEITAVHGDLPAGVTTESLKDMFKDVSGYAQDI